MTRTGFKANGTMNLKTPSFQLAFGQRNNCRKVGMQNSHMITFVWIHWSLICMVRVLKLCDWSDRVFYAKKHQLPSMNVKWFCSVPVQQRKQISKKPLAKNVTHLVD